MRERTFSEAATMTAKQYLEQLGSLDRRIAVKRRDIADLRGRARSVTGSAETSVSASGTGDRVGSAAARIAGLERGIQSDIDSYVTLRAEITAVIDKVPDSLYVDILYRRYVHGQTWEKIAEEMNYAIRHVYRLHGQALREVSRVMTCH